MKRILILSLSLLLLGACGSDDSGNNNGDNPFLTDPFIDITIDLNLPQYNPLNFPGETVIINGQGIRGVVVFNLNNSTYLAFDLTDPNIRPNNCSRMELEGIIATCPCPDVDNSYNLGLFGQHITDPNKFPMQQYRAERIGDQIIVSN